MNLGSMNDALFHNRDASDTTPVFKIDEDQEKRIVEDIKTHKYRDIIKKLRSIPDNVLIGSGIIDRLLIRSIVCNNLVVYAYLLQQFPNEIISQSDSTIKLIFCPVVSVDTFAGIICSSPKLFEMSKEPAYYMYDMIEKYSKSIWGKGITPESCYCFEDLISKIICVLEIPIVDTSRSIQWAFCQILTFYNMNIAMNHYSHRMLVLLFNHAKTNNLLFDVECIDALMVQTLTRIKRPLVFIKFCHEILKLPTDFLNRDRETLLWAIRDIQCAQYLIHNGVDVNWTNTMGHTIVQDMIYKLEWREPRDPGGSRLQYMQWLVTHCNVDMGSRSQIEDWIKRYFTKQKNFDAHLNAFPFERTRQAPFPLSVETKEENLIIIDWVRGYLNQTVGSTKN